MGSKQDTIERIRGAREAGTYPGPVEDPVVRLFREHYDFAKRSLTPEHAAANAYDAIQRYLAVATLNMKQTGAGDP